MRNQEAPIKDIQIGSIVWGVRDIPRAVAFWTAALDYRIKVQGADWAILLPREGQNGVQLSLNLVSSDKARRHHMDLFARNQEEEVARLLGLGARRMPWNYPEDADYVVLQDPEGNPFCVVSKP